MSPDDDADRNATRPFLRAPSAPARPAPEPGAVPSGSPSPSGEPPPAEGLAEEPPRAAAVAEESPPAEGPAGEPAAGLAGESPLEAPARQWAEAPAEESPAAQPPRGAAAPAAALRELLARLPQGRRLAALAGGAAVGAALVVALVVAEVSLAHANAVDHARSAAMTAAESFAVDISSYDYRHLDQDFKRVTDHATGRLKTDFTTASRSLTPLLVRVKGTATGTVVAAGVADATTDRATVVVLLDQTVSNTTAPAPRLDRSRLVMTLTHGSSGWLVDSVQPR